MHDMRIALDDHFLGQPDAADAADPPRVVTSQIDQHQMLGQFLGVGQQVFFQRQILGLVPAARTGAGDRAHGDHAIFQAHQDLGRRPDDIKVVQVEIEHVG